jgi:hypothetical protein
MLSKPKIQIQTNFCKNYNCGISSNQTVCALAENRAAKQMFSFKSAYLVCILFLKQDNQVLFGCEMLK